jgi:parallel beta-helix repeat protein
LITFKNSTSECSLRNGIYLSSTHNNEIIGNNINSNDVGIYLTTSSNNKIYLNSFNNYNNNVYSISSNNIWNSTEPITYQYKGLTFTNYTGNNWSDYTGTDSNSDGIGDTAYPIPSSSDEDRYPLMFTYISPTLPPPEIQDKSLLHVEGQPEVYWFQNNKLYWVTDWDVINQMSGIPGWDSVNTLPASEFDPANYEQGPRFISTGAESDGLLIRQVGDYKIYYIENGNKRHITYPDVMDLKDYSFDDVIEVSSEISNMFQVGEPIGIEVDLYFNKSIDSVETSHESQFTTDETVKLIIETTVTEDYTVETYVKMIKPDGTEKYAYYENVDFLIADQLKFSDTERPLYPGTWHAQKKKWNWNEYVFIGDEMEGVYTWEFWYKDSSSGKILGKDVQGYTFSKTPPNQVDIIPPEIVLISPSDVTFYSNVVISAIAYDPSGIETCTVTVNGQVLSWGLGGSIYIPFVNLNAGMNEITISAKDNSENHNERIEKWTVIHYPFSAQMPYQLDRFTPEEFTTLNGEVIGGTPPFDYKWKVNDNTYSETSDKYNIQYPLTEILESGKYKIQLEVTDDQGYTINAKEKQINISPLNEGST